MMRSARADSSCAASTALAASCSACSIASRGEGTGGVRPESWPLSDPLADCIEEALSANQFKLPAGYKLFAPESLDLAKVKSNKPTAAGADKEDSILDLFQSRPSPPRGGVR